MNRLNNVVVKLWLTIIFIVTTVLILLSAALITFIQSYFTQETEDSLLEDAKRISHLVEHSEDKTTAIKHSKSLIEGPVGLIIMNHKHMDSVNNDETKEKMFKEIKSNKNYEKVFDKGKQISEHVTIDINKQQKNYDLIGYPLKNLESSIYISKYIGVYFYKDLINIYDFYQL